MAAVKKPHRGMYQPGVSGNPGGKPVGARSMTAVLRQRLGTPNAKRIRVEGGRTPLDDIVDGWVEAMRERSPQHISMALDRTEGKVPTTLVLEGGAKPVSLVVVRGVSLDDL